MNLQSKQKIKPRFAIGALALCGVLSIQLTVIAEQKAHLKRNGAEIAIACFKWMPDANSHETEGFIVGACDSQYRIDRAKFRLCVQNGKRKFKELKAKKR